MSHSFRFATIPFLLAICASSAPALAGSQAAAVTPAATKAPDPPVHLPEDLVRFFAGHWQGQGAFASGRKIEADVDFESSMDGQWLVYRHADRAPNNYKAQGFWGYERTSRAFVMVLADNFGGARLFSSTGWKDDTLVFDGRGPISPASLSASSAPPPSGATFHERFVFEKQSADQFLMRYETRKNDADWRLVDSLTFKRKP